MSLRAWWNNLTEPDVEQPAWAAALQELHDGDGIVTIPHPESTSSTHPFVEEAELTTEEAETAFEYLEHAGLIEKADESEDSEYVISREGFQVAHERELNQRQWEIEIVYAVVTAGLFVVTTINFTLEQYPGWIGTLTSAILGILFIYSMFQLKRPA